jgi:hypothetical protein
MAVTAPDDSPRGWPAADLVPRPDPTKLTTEAVEKATAQYRRELTALREIIETRLAGTDEDRSRLWDAVNRWPPHLEGLLEHRRREFLEDLVSVRELTEQRLADLDKAIKLAADELAKLAARTESERAKVDAEMIRRQQAERELIVSQVELVRAVMTEKFTAVDGRFEESKVAVDAAFAAAKEAVAEQNKANSQAITKSETATKEQLASLSRVTDAGIAGLSDKITDARDRLTVIESLTRGIKEASGEFRSDRAENIGERGLRLNGLVVALMSFSALLSVIAVVLTLALRK